MSADNYYKWMNNARANMLTETENTYEEIYNYLRKHDKKYAREFEKNAAWPDEIIFPKTKPQLTSKFSKNLTGAFADLIGKELRKQGISLSEFNKMRMKSMANLSNKEVKILKEIRDSVPRPDKNTVLQKTIPEKEINNYLGDNGYNKIRGFIVKRVDAQHLTTYDDIVEGLRVDYVDADGNRPYPPGGDTFGYIIFQSNDADKIGIPYGKKFGGNATDKWPCTLNGLLAAEDDITPEWVVLNEYGIEVRDGAELHRVVGEDDRIIGVFRDGHFREVGD